MGSSNQSRPELLCVENVTETGFGEMTLTAPKKEIRIIPHVEFRPLHLLSCPVVGNLHRFQLLTGR